jgi:hypothetical protein
MRHTILNALVGSRAHGLERPDSDTDLKAVYVTDTAQFFVLGSQAEYRTPKASRPLGQAEPAADSAEFEVGHFLHLATKSNPSILEVMRAPQLAGTTGLGREMVSLFPHVWSSERVYQAFRGYGQSQRRRMFEGTEAKGRKYAMAWLRTLYNARRLLETGDFELSVVGTAIEPTLLAWRDDKSTFDLREVESICGSQEVQLDRAYADNGGKRTDYQPVNDFIIKVRRRFFT